MTLRSRLLLGLALAASPGLAWAVGPNYRPPDLGLTEAYHAGSSPAAHPAALDAWWAEFHDPALTRAVERALAQNLDLVQARQRVLQSRAAARAAGAALAPQARIQASAADVGQSLRSPIGEIASGFPAFERNYEDYAVGVGASWEIDLFGGLRRTREAARADARAAAFQAEAVRTSVAAETADAYLQVRGLQGRLAVAERQLKVQRDLVDLLGQRTAQGVASDRELRQARAAYQGVDAAIPPLRAALDAQLNRLDVLMGAQAGTYRTELAAAGEPPEAPSLALAGPADLLRRRPDVMAAEQRLIGANARIGAALSDYYPKVSITALLGFESLASGAMFSQAALGHQAGVGLGWRLFDFGRVDAEVAQARGRDAEALAAYRAVVFKATEEVETAVSDMVQQQVRAQALARQVDELTVARRQAQDAYEGGVASLVEVRDLDRDSLGAADQLVQARTGAARAAVAAYRALGGGWSPRPSRVSVAGAPPPPAPARSAGPG